MHITTIKNSLVVSTNDLVHAKYGMSLWQKRVFIYAISQLEKGDTEFKPIKMNIADIIKFFKGSDSGKAYRAIMEAPKHLDRAIEIPYMTEKGFLRYGFVRLLQKYTVPADVQNDNQYIEIYFNNDLKVHLLELKEKFLKYDIRNVIELQSVYSFRLFEILKSYEFRKEIELEVDYLRKVLEIGNIYKAFKDFKKRIIDKAQEDLSEFCDIGFTYEEKKGAKGKKIESLVFRIYKNDSKYRDTTREGVVLKEQSIEFTEFTPIEVPEEKKVDTNHEKLTIELYPIVVSQFGVSLKVFIALVEAHTEGEVRQAIQVTEKARQAGKVENSAGFFVNALKNHYQDAELQKKEDEASKIAEKKVKAEALKKTETTAEEQKKQAVRNESQRKINIIKDLVQKDASLIHQAVNELRNSMFRGSYDPAKTMDENLESAMFAGTLMNVLQKIEPTVFWG